MGALLVSLAPYFAPVLMETFRKAIAPLAVSANTSIAIIACFTFLSHFSSLGNMATFVESLRVIHHFAANLSPFLAQISGIVRAMSPLELQFHKVLLRSLLPLFRDSLNFHIVAVASGILARSPEQLLPDVLGHPTVFGHLRLTDPAFETLITSEHKRAIFERAETVLATGGTLNTAEFERAVETIVAIRRHPEFRDEVMKFATQWLQRSFPAACPAAVDADCGGFLNAAARRGRLVERHMCENRRTRTLLAIPRRVYPVKMPTVPHSARSGLCGSV
jgi:hypothetical protein